LPSDDDLSKLQDYSPDWINSEITFQHIPTERGHRIFDRMCHILAAGGVISVHLNIFKSPEMVQYFGKPYYAKQLAGGIIQLGVLETVFNTFTAENMAMYDYDLNIMFAILGNH